MIERAQVKYPSNIHSVMRCGIQNENRKAHLQKRTKRSGKKEGNEKGLKGRVTKREI